MRTSLMLALLLFAALITVPVPAFPWGATGHRVTGALAEELLAPTTRLAVREILGVETLAEASTWPDEQRSNPAPFWQETAGPWHYVTVPPGERYEDVGAPEEGDAYTALARFRETLRDPASSPAERRLALRFAVHVIGDLHQPLHAGNGTDRGGNDRRVTWFREPSNLHRVWDSQMIDGQRLSYSEWSEWLGARLTPEKIEDWGQTDPGIWIAESTRLRDALYPTDDDLGWSYQYRHIDTVRERLTQAGVRVAAWLDEVFEAR